MSKYDDLVTKLKEIFQIDKPELDFGVYRILNARVVEINDYLENRLKAKVAESLATSGAANLAGLQKELKEKEAQYTADGIDPNTVPKIQELKQKLAAYTATSAEHENAVFTHLLTFFSRYYDKGDFISQRRYKGDTYAIPYAGEEVVLHWANKDQYYTKSGENFTNYGFKLDDGRTVRFRLISADTAKDNRKDNDKDRRFVLIESQTQTLTDEENEEYQEQLEPIAEENGELVLRFEYKAMPKGSKQDDLVAQAAKIILNHPIVKAHWLDLTNREPTEKNPQRTLLEKCLTNYTAKNSADYFIHKDLGAFLRRELDFYIKNEVMNLDDVQYAEKFADIEHNLRMIQTLRSIALDLITFLAQLEDFQKKLWLKKKFIVAAHYCITLDRIIKDAPVLLDTIAANPRQWAQWEALGMLRDKTDLINQAATGSVDYLQENPYLMVDSALFDFSFKQALLAAIHDLDNGLDGLLIHGDNFQALNLLQERYRGQVKCIYVDPPYNTGNDGFLYKDVYQHSSWITAFENRLDISKPFLSNSGAIWVSIDSREHSNLRNLLDANFGVEEFVADIAVVNNWKGRQDKAHIATAHENVFLYARSDFESFGFPLSEDKIADYDLSDSDGLKYGLRDLRKRGGADTRESRPNMFFPIYWNESKKKAYLGRQDELDVEIFPYKSDGVEGCWRWGIDTVKKNIDILEANQVQATGRWNCSYRVYLENDGVIRTSKPKSTWMGSKYSSDRGIKDLRNLFPDSSFSSPKSPFFISDIITHSTCDDELILDFYSGSGTTAHGLFLSNREDDGRRKYILVEQGDYFDTVLKLRIQKVVYSADWKDGQPTAPHTGISHAFKVLKIESYEDALNNLELRQTQQQTDLLESLPQSTQDDYLLRYMLDIESRGSLLSVEQFAKPFDFTLKVTVDSAGAYEERPIDMVETFNYLIGLHVKHIDMNMDKGFVLVTGLLPSGEKTLVLWRDVERVDYESLNRLCDKLAINPADSEYEVVYINGDHNIPAVFTSLENEGGITKTLKIRQIEPEFLNRMFAAENA
jgi:adenine-specific DNA-methyltransferase